MSSASQSGPALAGPLADLLPPFLHTLLLSPTVVQRFSQWSLVRYERGEVKPLRPGAGSQLLTAGNQPVYPKWKEVARVSPLPLKPDPPSPSGSTMLIGRFQVNLEDVVLKAVRSILLPQKSPIHIMLISVVQNKHISFCKMWLVLHPRIPLGAHHHPI